MYIERRWSDWLRDSKIPGISLIRAATKESSWSRMNAHPKSIDPENSGIDHHKVLYIKGNPG